MVRGRYNSRKNLSNKYRVQTYRARQRIFRSTENRAIEHSERIRSDHLIFEDESFPIQSQKTTRELLKSWVNIHGVTMRSVNDLLKILNKAGELC